MSAETMRAEVALLRQTCQDADAEAHHCHGPEREGRLGTSLIWPTLNALAVVVADTEGIARVLREHAITSGYDWNEEPYSYCRCGAKDVGPSHQAAAVAAYLASG